MIIIDSHHPQYGFGETVFFRDGSKTAIVSVYRQVVTIGGYGNGVTVLYLRKGVADQREQGAEGKENMFFHMLRV